MSSPSRRSFAFSEIALFQTDTRATTRPERMSQDAVRRHHTAAKASEGRSTSSGDATRQEAVVGWVRIRFVPRPSRGAVQQATSFRRFDRRASCRCLEESRLAKNLEQGADDAIGSTLRAGDSSTARGSGRSRLSESLAEQRTATAHLAL